MGLGKRGGANMPLNHIARSRGMGGNGRKEMVMEGEARKWIGVGVVVEGEWG